MNTTIYSFLVSGFAGLSTLLGCFFLFGHKKHETILIGSLGFASGVMLCVSITDLLPSGYGLFRETFFVIPSLLLCAVFFVCGIVLSLLIDRYLPSGEGMITTSKLYRVGLIAMLAIILHNIPEGIATFVTTRVDTSLGMTLALAIALHNIPEGISISVPIYYATGKKYLAFFYTLISGLSEPLGALLAYLFLGPWMNSFVMGLLLSMIAGIMTSIACYELLPTSCSYRKKSITFVSLGCGILIMLVSHFWLG